ncbi:MAG: relaxase domain-containing protein [Proteobacteria bacterium]|nr:relaxase domain-containing protein [Pseudomonadota bacterium]
MLSIQSARDSHYYYSEDLEPSPAKTLEADLRSVDPFWWTSRRTDNGWAKYQAPIDWPAFRRLAAGSDPQSGKRLVRDTYRDRVQFHDLTFSAPKSVSLLWMSGDAATRRRIEILGCAAVERALDFVFSERLLYSRRGKAGWAHDPPAELVAPLFVHVLSRAGDPNKHVHVPLPNVAVREDGTTGALDTRRLLGWLHTVDAVFQCELSWGLVAEFGLFIVPSPYGFEVAGIKSDWLLRFSKRRRAIVAMARANGYETKDNPARARMDSLRTRPPKASLPSADDLERRWTAELAEIGLVRGDIWKAARHAVETARPAAQWNEREIRDRILAPIERQLETSPFLERRELFRLSLKAMLGGCSADMALEATTELIGNGRLIEVQSVHQSCYTSHANLRAQREILFLAGRRGVAPELPAAWVRRTLATSTASWLEVEQVAHALGRGTVSVLLCPSGPLRSRLLCLIGAVAKRAGLPHVIGHASTLRPEEFAEAYRLHASPSLGSAAGSFPNGGRAVIIVDEAGSVPLQKMAALIVQMAARNMKVILVDAADAMLPLQEWNAFRILGLHVGTSALSVAMRRQSGWMRAATLDFGRGGGGRAFAEYERRGLVTWAADQADAMSTIIHELEADILGELGQTRRLVVTPTWASARALTPTLRAICRSAGLLQGADIRLTAEGEESNGAKRPREIMVAVGDRLALTRRVGGVQHWIASGIGTVVSVRSGVTAAVAVQLDGGGLQWIEDARLIDYAYALPWSSASDVSCDRAWLLVSGALGPADAAIAFTRQHETLRVVLDTNSLIGPAYGRDQRREPASFAEITQMARNFVVSEMSDPARAGRLDPIAPGAAMAGAVGASATLRRRMSARCRGARYPLPRLDAAFLTKWEPRLRAVFGQAMAAACAWRTSLWSLASANWRRSAVPAEIRPLEAKATSSGAAGVSTPAKPAARYRAPEGAIDAGRDDPAVGLG